MLPNHQICLSSDSVVIRIINQDFTLIYRPTLEMVMVWGAECVNNDFYELFGGFADFRAFWPYYKKYCYPEFFSAPSLRLLQFVSDKLIVYTHV